MPVQFEPKAIEAIAESWASIDGHLEAYRRERDTDMPIDHPRYTGHYDGYIEEAKELIRRMFDRGFIVVPRGAPARVVAVTTGPRKLGGALVKIETGKARVRPRRVPQTA